MPSTERSLLYLKDPNIALFKPSPNISPSKRPEIQAGGKNFFNRQTAQWKFQIERTSLMMMGENKKIFKNLGSLISPLKPRRLFGTSDHWSHFNPIKFIYAVKWEIDGVCTSYVCAEKGAILGNAYYVYLMWLEASSYLKDQNIALCKPSPNILHSQRPEIQAGEGPLQSTNGTMEIPNRAHQFNDDGREQRSLRFRTKHSFPK
ncbi:hypothetical protein CEXT_358571 [Caerostris extrusa]|uniref:Uncharacterized protein n=1 Tax=Caerostris extrusa TaxID=172846 RepID=A0AAV4XCG7_CAEEX|nr:hypothetical protein CEXT_358571 [Caerostris extrusa]